MKNMSLILIILLVIAIGGVGAYALMTRSTPSMAEPESMAKIETISDDQSAMADTDEKMQAETEYVTFFPEQLSSSASNRRVLFFYANWCPTCKPADKNFSDNSSKIPSDVTVIRVNYKDTETDQAEKELAQKYNVTYQHTFVQIDAEGNEVAKWNGGQLDELLSNLK